MKWKAEANQQSSSKYHIPKVLIPKLFSKVFQTQKKTVIMIVSFADSVLCYRIKSKLTSYSYSPFNTDPKKNVTHVWYVFSNVID